MSFSIVNRQIWPEYRGQRLIEFCQENTVDRERTHPTTQGNKTKLIIKKRTLKPTSQTFKTEINKPSFVVQKWQYATFGKSIINKTTQTVSSPSYSSKRREERSSMANGSCRSNTKGRLHAQERTLHLLLVASGALHDQRNFSSNEL